MTRDSLSRAVNDCQNLLIWLIPLLDNFPRNRRFTLGERLETGLLEILELLVEVAYTKHKGELLQLHIYQEDATESPPQGSGETG